MHTNTDSTQTSKVELITTKLNKAAEAIGAMSAGENRAELESQSIVYGAFLTDYQNEKIAHNEESEDLLDVVDQFCELILA